MLRTDLDEFGEILTQLCDVYGKTTPPKDAMRDAYWVALGDLSLATVRQCAEHHMRYAKFFPRPSELRPRHERVRPKDSGESAKHITAVNNASIKRWEQLRAEDPQRWRWALLDVVCFRADVRGELDKLAVCERTCRAFLDEDGEAYIERDWIAWRLTCRFFPHVAHVHIARRQVESKAA